MIMPNYRAMAEARAAVDEQLNKALAFLAPTSETLVVPVEAAQKYITARIDAAREGLRRFEIAAKDFSND